MRRIILLSFIIISIGTVLSGCANPSSSLQQQRTTLVKAVYLVPQNGGLLSPDELEQHPEVVVVSSFGELKKYVDKKVAILIDKDAVAMIEQGWLQMEPQKRYPIVVVGYDDSLYSFREKLSGFEIQGPKVEWIKKTLEPGFSVWMLREETSSSKSAFMRGYRTKPTVELILGITNDLLKNKIPDYIVEDRVENQYEIVTPIKSGENLSTIEFLNLNNESNLKVSMTLKEGWTATRLTWENPQGFEYNEYKNKFITELYEYYIYNENKEEIGRFGFIGWYHNSDSSSFPNHRQSTIIRYKGPTKIGNGTIYLLKLDLPREQTTKDKNYFLEYYALIPIKYEHLSYNFTLKVPENQNPEEILLIMKKILGADSNIEEQIHILFKDEKNSTEKAKKIIALLPGINWSNYFKAYDTEGFDLMNWLSTQKIDQENLITILSSSYGLDGAYADSYCHLVSTLYLKDRLSFIKALSSIEPEQVDTIVSCVSYDFSKDNASREISELEKLHDTDDLFPREKDMIMKLVDALSKEY